MSRYSHLYATDRPHLRWQRARVWWERYRNASMDDRLMLAMMISLVIAGLAVGTLMIWGTK